MHGGGCARRPEASYNDHMPIFEYRCHSCGATFERLSWGGEQIPTCGCGSQKAERIWFSRVAVARGSGEGDSADFGGGEDAGDACCGGEDGACCGGDCGNGNFDA